MSEKEVQTWDEFTRSLEHDRLLKHMAQIDALESRIAELEAELAERKQWAPLPDGLHFIDDAANNGTHILASLGGTTIEFENESGKEENDRYIVLPSDMRLCHRTANEQEQS